MQYIKLYSAGLQIPQLSTSKLPLLDSFFILLLLSMLEVTKPLPNCTKMKGDYVERFWHHFCHPSKWHKSLQSLYLFQGKT